MAETATRSRPHVRSVLPASARGVQGHRAGVVSRTLVMLVDVAVVAGAVGVGYLLWAGIRFMRRPVLFVWPDITYAAAVVAALIVCVLYLTVTWSTTGRSVGKRLLGLRVVGAEGRAIGLIRAFLRALTCTLFPLLLYWATVSKRNRSVHDVVFRTSVVYDWRSRPRSKRPTDAAQTPASGDDSAGSAVDVAPPVADESDDRHPEPLTGLDGE